MLLRVSIGCLLFGSCLIGSKSEAANKFIFTAIPDQDESALRKRFDGCKIPVGRFQKRLSMSREIIRSCRHGIPQQPGSVGMVWGSVRCACTDAVKGSTAIAQGKADPFFETLLQTPVRVDLVKDFPKKIAGKTFTFGSKGSTSGRLMPEYHIRKHSVKRPKSVQPCWF